MALWGDKLIDVLQGSSADVLLPEALSLTSHVKADTEFHRA